MKMLMMILILLFSFSAIQAQESEELNPISDLEFLVGEWEGEGWILTPNGKFPLISTEIVQKKVGNQALLVEGFHRRRTETGDAGEMVFEAIALVTYNNERANFDFRSASDRSRGGNFIAEMIGQDSLQWGLENSFRYIIILDEQGRWHEIGESTRDNGETWTQFFEMTLEKQE